MEYNILRDWLSNHQFTWEKLGDILTCLLYTSDAADE